MSVLDRSDLEASPLADLHVIAGELGLDGFRRMRKAQLIDAIVQRQGGDAGGDSGEEDSATEPAAEAEPDAEPDTDTDADADADAETERPRRRRRGGRGRGRRAAERDGEDDAESSRGGDRGDRGDRGDDEGGRDRAVEGAVELMGNGSGFVRVSPPEPSDEDVYISAAQVRRCELVSGDVVTGPVRGPRRSERYPSLVRVDTINGTPADEVSEGTRYEDLPAAFPSERLALGSEDPTLRAIEWLTPFGKGSRVSIVGAARSGKTEALLRIVATLAPGAESGGYELAVALAGVRPEEVALWQDGPVAPTAAVSFAASGDAQAQAVDTAVEQGRRRAARGSNVVLVIDTLDAVTPSVARRALGAARNIVDGGSLTVIATSQVP
ncbi:MAG TPA: Rho termination factor N-terminal domain-containing protein, partial [Solirubrobacteraceae bacterium]|nr:Rho termination factor N-terminal domain-containing protein [Solirubrobacteraceae bacterium]